MRSHAALAVLRANFAVARFEHRRRAALVRVAFDACAHHFCAEKKKKSGEFFLSLATAEEMNHWMRAVQESIIFGAFQVGLCCAARRASFVAL